LVSGGKAPDQKAAFKRNGIGATLSSTIAPSLDATGQGPGCSLPGLGSSISSDRAATPQPADKTDKFAPLHLRSQTQR